MIDVADLRRSYTMSGLDEKDLPEKPIELFEKWLQECDLQVIKRFENGKKDAVVVAEKKHEP